jgi:hypothetical protein
LIKADSTERSKAWKWRQFYIIQGNQAFIFSLLSEASIFDRHLVTCDEPLRTFRIHDERDKGKNKQDKENEQRTKEVAAVPAKQDTKEARDWNAVS